MKPLFRITALLTFVALCTVILHNGFKQFYSAAYPLDYQHEITTTADKFNLPPSLIYAIIHTESGFDPQAISSAEAKGLMQLTDDTFQWARDRAKDKQKYTDKALFDPTVNIHYGVYVLTLLREQFDHIETILAAYNAGQGNVSQWLKDTRYSADGKTLHTIPFPETAHYVTRVLDTQQQYQTLYSIL